MRSVIESVFISHGAPTYALDPGEPGSALRIVGQQMLAQGSELLILVSPHWRSATLAVTSHEAPVIVHDFHGFPKALYELKPEIAGAPEMASKLGQFLGEKGAPVDQRLQQGFDHGAWVPYLHLFPQGGPRLVQLSMPVEWTGKTAMAVGKLVGEFARANRAVVVGSGSLTHNFDDMDLRAGSGGSRVVPGHVTRFTEWVSQRLKENERMAIAQADQLAPGFARVHPDDDHYLPLPFALGAASENAEVEVLPEDVRYRALSMQSYVFRTVA
ncbi:MAG TPA: class III extradiol ring-cleavage dioxygenase [Limnobacter sp.]|nr:class III extradiol ring-cleavage dioxygenase [Limnobacter sp.]